jgi:hypothetical protein
MLFTESPFSRWSTCCSIKIDHRETGWGGIAWTHLVPDSDQWRVVVNTVMSRRVPSIFVKWWIISMYRLERILTMVYVVQNSQNFSELFPSSCIQKKNTALRKLDQ